MADEHAPTSPPLRDEHTAALIASVTPQPLFKVFTTYTSPWWRASGYTKADGTPVPVEAGRSVTDLPVRQTYYWPREDGTPATDGPSMLMASYDDGTNIGFWDGLRPRRPRLCGHRRPAPGHELRRGARLVRPRSALALQRPPPGRLHRPAPEGLLSGPRPVPAARAPSRRPSRRAGRGPARPAS